MKHKSIKGLVRHIQKQTIYDHARLTSLNNKLNKEIFSALEGNPKNKIALEELRQLTDEITFLADAALLASPVAKVSMSSQFAKKQEELCELYQKAFGKKGV